MFIDIHAHAYRIQPVKPDNNTWITPEQLVEFYDKHDIDAGVLLPLVSPECNTPQCNEDILEMAEKYPQYEFEVHKGYGTRKHYDALREFGPSPIHRMSFLKKFYGEK